MVKEILVVFPTEAGAKLLQRLDEANLRVTAAFWAYMDERQVWVLFVATAQLLVEGSFPILLRIRAILDTMPLEEKADLTLTDVYLLRPDNDRVQALYKRFGTITEPRWGRDRRANPTDEDPYIYRLTVINNVTNDRPEGQEQK